MSVDLAIRALARILSNDRSTGEKPRENVFCWIGHRRFARPWAVPQIQTVLLDAYAIRLSDTAITQFTHRYQTMVAARQQDPEHLRQHDEGVDEVILSIDGLQPEKGHETLYVVQCAS